MPQLVKLLDYYFYEDMFLEAEEVILFTEKMAKLGMIVLDKNSTIILDEDDEEIVQFLNCEESLTIKEDRKLFDWFYKEGINSEGWKTSFDEPDRRVRYKLEDGLSQITAYCECVVDAPLIDVIAMYSEIEIFKDWFPQVTGA